MAINKNFVVKNGIEVNTSLIVADTTLNKVGVGTTVPGYTLHVGGSRGGIGATDLTVTGIATVGTSGSTSAALSVVGVSSFQGDVNFLGSAGVSTITFDASLDKLNFADNARATFGASDDLQIFHDGSNSIIRETGTGNIVLEGSGETLAVFADDGAVSLYYDNENVFQTTPQGVNVSGVTTSNRLNISGVSTFTSIGSNLIPDGDGSRNIGAAGSEWQNLFIDGTANIDTLAADTAAIGDLTENRVVIAGSSGELEDDGNLTFDGTTLAVTGKETVSVDITVGSGVTIQNHGGVSVAGISTFGGLVNANGGITAGTAKISDLTDNRVVIAGSNGELEDSANLTFDGSTLAVTGDETVSGKVSVGSGVTAFANGNLAVAGISTFNGNVLVGTGITIQPHGGVSIAGIVTVGGDLNVQGDITYDEIGGRNINITGFSTFGNDLNVGLTTFFVDVSNGGVGVGTDNPNPNGYGPQFKVFGNNPVLALEDDGGGVNAFGFVRQNSNTLQIVTGDNSDNKIQISKTSDTSSSWTGSNLTNVVTIDQGNIGVGIATASLRDSAKLDVDGGGRFSGSVIVKDGGNAGAGVTIFDNGNIIASGIITATEFSGPFSGSTGSFSGDLSIADKIVHIGDTNTAIRFPAADTFTVETGGNEAFRVDSSQRLILGATSAVDTGTTSLIQAVNAGGARIVLARNDTSTAQNDSIGRIRFYGNDSDGNYDECARLDVIADADHTSTSKASALTVHTTASGAESPTEALRVDSSQRLLVGADGASDLIRHGQAFAVATTDEFGGGSFTGFNGTTANEGPIIDLQRSRATSKSPGTVVVDGDRLGSLVFRGDDGTDFADAAYMLGEVDGTPSGGFVPGRLTLFTGTTSATPTERLRITSAGLVGINTTPGTLLELKGESSKEAEITFNRQPVQGTNDGIIGQLLFENNTDSVAQISVKRESAADDAYIQFANQATSGGVTEKLRITSAGLVSIQNDTGKFTAGTDSEMQVFHDGTDSLIKDTRNSGSVKIQADNFSVIDKDASETMLSAVVDGAVTLNHNGSARVTTTADGADFSGTGSIKIPVGTTAQRNGSPTAGDFRYNSTLGQFEGYTDSWGEIGGSGGVSETDTSVSTTTATGVGSFAVATHRSAAIIAQIDQGGSYQVGRYLMIHDGTTATVIEESAIATGDMLGSFSADINNSNAELKVTMNSSGIATVTTKIDTVTV